MKKKLTYKDLLDKMKEQPNTLKGLRNTIYLMVLIQIELNKENKK